MLKYIGLWLILDGGKKNYLKGETNGFQKCS